MNTMDEKKTQPKINLENIWKSMTIIQKVKYVWQNVTVEPLLACYIMPSVLSGLATQNLNLEKACRVNLQYDDEICDALTRRETSNYTLQEKEVQQLVAAMAGWKTVVQSALPCLLILFWGSWSDRHCRRKPCMLIPIIGEFISAVGLILCTYFKNTRMEVVGITEALFPGLAGGWFTMMMGIFSYIADVTHESDRTLRIGIANLFVSLGVPIGMAFSGILLKMIGFYGIFSISAVFYLIAFIYGVFFVPEPKPRNETLKGKQLSDVGILRDFFNKDHVVETFRVAFKKGEHQRRVRVIMLMIVVMVVIGPMYGEMAVFYLFTRFRFNWSEVEFSIFSTYNMIIGLIGTTFSVGVFSHMLQIDDALIGVFSSLSKIMGSFVYAFSVKAWQLYLGPIIETFNGTSFIAMRSIASKLVASDELGKVNSLVGVAEALMPLLYAPLYTTLYAATLNVLPGAFFLLGGALTIPAVFIFLWMYKVHRKDKVRLEQMKKTNLENGQIQIQVIDHKKDISSNGYKGNEAVTVAKSTGVENEAFEETEQDCGIIHEAAEIVKDLPVMGPASCKL